MTGILLLLAVAAWIVICWMLVKGLCSRIKTKSIRLLVQVLLLGAIVPAPIVDELIARHEFRRLCDEISSATVSPGVHRDKTVWFGGGESVRIRSLTLNAFRTKMSYVDVTTQEPVYHYYRIEAHGGWLSKFLRILDGGRALTYKGFCQAKDLTGIKARLGIVEIDRHSSN